LGVFSPAIQFRKTLFSRKPERRPPFPKGAGSRSAAANSSNTYIQFCAAPFQLTSEARPSRDRIASTAGSIFQFDVLLRHRLPCDVPVRYCCRKVSLEHPLSSWLAKGRGFRMEAKSA